jgi:hypothetical protein
MFVFGVVSIEVWQTELPAWAFILALVIGMFPLWWTNVDFTKLTFATTAFLYVIPIGMIQAITNQQVGLK